MMKFVSTPAIRKVREVRKCRSTAGFSLTEMLVTTLIMVMVTAMVASGIPAAMETYAKTVNAANAQAALSTAIAAMRGELGMASDVLTSADITNNGSVGVDSNDIFYLSSEGYWMAIGNEASDEMGKGLRKRYFKGSVEGVDLIGLTLDIKDDGDATGILQLVPDASVTEDLLVDIENPTYANGVVTIGKIKVTNKAGTELASVSDYKIQTRSNG